MLPLKTILIALAISTFVACGGGGSNSDLANNTTSTFQSVAIAGELVSYSVDRVNLSYAYTITESAYGKTGVTGSGTLTRNNDGTYTPSGFSNARLKVLDNGLLVGAIYEDLDGDAVKEIIPVIGISNPVAAGSEAEGVYNFVSRQCVTAGCASMYGTLKVTSDGTWTSCESGNLGVAPTFPACASSKTGTVANFANGKGDVMVGGTKAGSMLIFKDSANQKVILLDLNGGVASMGKGAFFASTQGFPSSTDGTWHYATTVGSRGTTIVTGNNFVDSGFTKSGYAFGPYNYTLQFNQPWTGLGRTTTGNTVGILAGAGMFAAYNGRADYITVGVR
jgi:hypothetical protein